MNDGIRRLGLSVSVAILWPQANPVTENRAGRCYRTVVQHLPTLSPVRCVLKGFSSFLSVGFCRFNQKKKWVSQVIKDVIFFQVNYDELCKKTDRKMRTHNKLLKPKTAVIHSSGYT